MRAVEPYKFSRSREALGFHGGQLIVCGDGFAGNMVWLARVKGAEEPVIPTRIDRDIERAPSLEHQVTQLLRAARRARRFAGSVDVGTVRPGCVAPEIHERPLLHQGIEWPYALNANYTEHLERCWPIGDWWLLGDGTLLRIQHRSGRPLLRAICMGIRRPPPPRKL